LYQWRVFLEAAKIKNPELKESFFVFEDRYLTSAEIKNLLEKGSVIK
jgi:hypothetical protein